MNSSNTLECYGYGCGYVLTRTSRSITICVPALLTYDPLRCLTSHNLCKVYCIDFLLSLCL